MATKSAAGVKISPLADRVVVKASEDTEQMRGGLYIPDTAKEKPQQGEIIAAGPGKYEDGKLVPMSVKVGDKVLYGRFAERSDAASSLVVALGIGGSLAGVRLLDPIAAAIVGFLVARMGWVFGWNALQDLSDRALDETSTADIRKLLMTTPGVRDVHELRTRKMGDFALVDAHILVDPLISVSEGHYIAESARARALTDKRIIDALIHVDPENDAVSRSTTRLPTRAAVVALVDAELAKHGLRAAGLNVHYLSTGLDVDITLAADALADREHDEDLAKRLDLSELQARLGARRITVQRRVESASTSPARHA